MTLFTPLPLKPVAKNQGGDIETAHVEMEMAWKATGTRDTVLELASKNESISSGFRNNLQTLELHRR